MHQHIFHGSDLLSKPMRISPLFANHDLKKNNQLATKDSQSSDTFLSTPS
jgi:hypothetical protein